jgi:hypothetical protein
MTSENAWGVTSRFRPAAVPEHALATDGGTVELLTHHAPAGVLLQLGPLLSSHLFGMRQATVCRPSVVRPSECALPDRGGPDGALAFTDAAPDR